MGMWDTPLPEPSRKKSDEPVAPVEDSAVIEAGILSPVKKGAKYVVNEANKGFWDFVGNVTEAAKAAGKEPMPFSLARIFFGNELIEALDISPYSKVKRAAEEDAALQGKLPKRGSDPFSKEGLRERFTTEMEAPGPVSEIIGGGARMLADPTNMFGMPVSTPLKVAPMLSKLARPASTSFFAGTGAETGKKIGGPLAAWLGGEESRGTGEALGSVAGAVAGGNVQDIRWNALSSVADAPINVGKAATAAVKAKRAGDERSVLRLFADNYGDLSANSQGILKEHVLATYANTIANDVQAQESLRRFEDAIKKSGGKTDAPWNLGARATTPVLVEEVRLRQPADLVEARQLDAANRATQNDVARRFKALLGRSRVAKADDVVESLDELRRTTNTKLDVLATEADEVANKVTHWDMPGTATTADNGAKLRALADAEIGVTREVARQKYGQAMQVADELGVEINPAKLRQQGSEILGEVLTQVDPKNAPPSLKRLVGILMPEQGDMGIRIKELQDKALMADGPTKLKLNNEISALRRQMKEAADAPLTLKDANDISVALGQDARAAAASGTPEAAILARNIERMRTSLEDTITSQLPDAARSAYEDARAYYRTVHAPRAREGANVNLQRRAGSARAGEERVVDEQVFNEYLKPRELETRMRQFDNLFGGALTGQRNDEAYKLLGQALEDTYYKKLLSRKSLSTEAHNNFMRDYNAALERLPDVRKKLDDTFGQLAALEDAKDAQVARWKSIARQPLTQAFGVDGAQQVMARALADPNRMNQLVNYITETQGEKGVKSLVKYVMESANPMRGDSYDGKKLIELLNAGKAGEKRTSAMQTLFRRAFGPDVGNKHYENLQAIATLAERQALTTPEFLRPVNAQNVDPIKERLGQSGASILQLTNNLGAGRVSALWAAAVGGGRFLNAKLNKAMRQLQFDALFDPQASAAVVEMAKTRADRPLARAAAQQLANRMGAEGKTFMQRLVDKGAILPVSTQSARIGVKTQLDEERDESER